MIHFLGYIYILMIIRNKRKLIKPEMTTINENGGLETKKSIKLYRNTKYDYHE
jgi:hypothetical protein